jgi:hypothetical protein
MLRHIVMLTFKPEASAENRAAVRAAGRDFAAFRRYVSSPAHKAYVAGPASAVARTAAIQHTY